MDEFELVDFQRKHFKDNFYQIWESNWSNRGQAGGVRQKSSTGDNGSRARQRSSTGGDKNKKAGKGLFE